jgi:NIMA (never in mitosis gene a)-related kinase
MEKYTIEKVVGEGSFGKALLCKRKADGRRCIIKQIAINKMGPKEAKQTEQESALLARLRHPNIVSFWESFKDINNPSKKYLYIVMEYADGGDLSDLLKKQRGKNLTEKKVITLFVQICLGMKHVHDRKILHRDLKPQNIFLTSAGMIKLGDFGIAKVLSNTGELASTQIGTPYFMSPEILNNLRYNNKTDIWSLGCVLFEMMSLKV